MKEPIGPLRVTGDKDYLTVRWRSEVKPPVLSEPADALDPSGRVVAGLTREGVVVLAAAVVAVVGGAALVAGGHRWLGWAVVGVGAVLTVLTVLVALMVAAARSWRRGRWVPLNPETSPVFAAALADELAGLGPTPERQEDAAARLWRRAVDAYRSQPSTCAIPRDRRPPT